MRTITPSNRRARRGRAAATVRPLPLRSTRGNRAPESAGREGAGRRSRPAIVYVAPRSERAVARLRLVVSNPLRPEPGAAIAPRRGHLTLVAARAVPALGPVAQIVEPWSDGEPRAYLMIVLGLAAAGLVAVATSIGRLVTAAL